MNNLERTHQQLPVYYSPQKQSSTSSRTFAEEAFRCPGEESPCFDTKKIQIEFATPDPKGPQAFNESYAIRCGVTK